MAGEKQTIEIELNNDHVTFMRIMKDDYNIPTESKVMRIIMDYLQENNDVHDAVFKQTRCLRCEQIVPKQLPDRNSGGFLPTVNGKVFRGSKKYQIAILGVIACQTDLEKLLGERRQVTEINERD